MIVSFILIFSILYTQTAYAFAKNYSENGTWKRIIKGTSWYFDVNDYTSRDPESKYYGVVYVYKGKFDIDNPKLQSEYYKTGNNKYKIKYSGGSITFKVKKKTILLKQVKGSVDGVKLNGKFKLVRRHYS